MERVNAMQTNSGSHFSYQVPHSVQDLQNPPAHITKTSPFPKIMQSACWHINSLLHDKKEQFDIMVLKQKSFNTSVKLFPIEVVLFLL